MLSHFGTIAVLDVMPLFRYFLDVSVGLFTILLKYYIIYNIPRKLYGYLLLFMISV